MRFVSLGSGALLLGLVASASALAQPAPQPAADISVTIYNNNLALVRDVRTLDLTSGRQRLEFKDVSAEIRPETASLTVQGVNVVEQNFDYDLLSPAKMMEKAVGRVVTIVRTNPATGAESSEQAEVLAVNNGVVLKIGDRIEVLRDDGLPARVIFDKVPENLRAQPTLSVMVDAAGAGARPVTLRYLTPGLGWRADYVAVYDETASKIDVQGWVTLTNTSGVSYDAAKTVLVAGTPSLAAMDDGDADEAADASTGMTQAGTETGNRARLGDFYLYPLAERTTIANRQTKQVSFLDVRGAPASHGYETRLAWMQTIEEPRSVQSVYRLSNSAQSGLGDQLPAGTVRFYINDKQGAAQFIGESPIGHTPMGSELSLSTGDAFDVKVKSVVESRQRNSLFHWKTAMRYTLSNALPKPVTVALIQDGLWGETRILAESQPSKRRSAESAEWTVEVPANGKTEVTATFDSKY
jgi:hypothetical protein